MRKELRSQVIKKEHVFKDAVGKLESVKKRSEDMIKFARGISRELHLLSLDLILYGKMVPVGWCKRGQPGL